MKKLLVFSFIFLSIYSPAQTVVVGRDAGKDELAVRKLLDEQTKAWNKGDMEGFMKTYWKSDSLMFIGKNGVTYGWANTLNNYQKNYPDTTAMGKLSFDIILVKRLSHQYFQVAGKWKLERSIGKLSGHYTLLLKKIQSKWLIIVDHSS
ncbi:MAG: YybH family protein [Chitinophagaceae bacterium]